MPDCTARLEAYEAQLGSIATRALRHGGDQLLDDVTVDLAVATDRLQRVRADELPLSQAVRQEIEASCDRAQRRLAAAIAAPPSAPRTDTA